MSHPENNPTTKTTKPATTSPDSSPNINSKLADLQSQIDWFYSGDFDLSKALENYEQATKLAKEIESDLSTLKNKIEIISRDFTRE